MFAKTRSAPKTASIEYKSRAAELSREIDGLVREYIVSRDVGKVTRASQLSREREELLKPKFVTSGDILKAG
jgi:hypothetical protein